MSKYNFKNYRDKNKRLIRFKIYEETFKLIKKIFNKTLFIPKKENIDNIFKLFLYKKLFSEFENNGLYPLVAHSISKKINNHGYSFFKINPLLYFMNIKNLNPFFNNITFIPDFRELLRIIFKKKKKIYFLEIINNKKFKKILLKYDSSIKSQLFWYDKSQYFNFIIIFENKQSLNNFIINKDDLDFLKNNMNYDFHKNNIKIYQFKSFKKTYYDCGNFYLTNNYFFKLILQIYYKLFNYYVNNWSEFLKLKKIDFFFSESISDFSNIYIFTSFKINKLKTFSYARSYFKGEVSMNFLWYFCDTIFIPGEHSAKNLKKSYNLYSNFVKIGSVNNFTKNARSKDIIVFDNIWSDNRNQNQVIYKNDINKFYETLFKFSLLFSGKLFIKLKKDKLAQNLAFINKIHNNYKFKLINNINIKKFNKFNFAIIISVFPSSVLVDLLANQIKCVLFDYGGFTKLNGNLDYLRLKNLTIVYNYDDLLKEIILLTKNNSFFVNDKSINFFLSDNNFNGKNIINDIFMNNK